MIEIARCESGFKQYETDGSALRNRQGSSAIGTFQIMRSYHEIPARNLGWDIHTLEGNMAYAMYLYKTEGTRPWDASKHCWNTN